MFSLGKCNAVIDKRVAALHSILNSKVIPQPKRWENWRANLPSSGIPLLGNDKYGCCVWASMFHYLQICAQYTGIPLPQTPTEDECLTAYKSTGFDPNNPFTDRGSFWAGPGGAAEYWIKNGIICGGVKNNLSNFVAVNYKDANIFKYALSLGPVFTGAILTESDVEAPFMWEDHKGAVAGGHMFLTVGYETLLSGKTYYDVVTWDGEWRYTDDWLLQSVDESYSVLNTSFFNKNNIDPAGIDWTTLQQSMTLFI